MQRPGVSYKTKCVNTEDPLLGVLLGPYLCACGAITHRPQRRMTKVRNILRCLDRVSEFELKLLEQLRDHLNNRHVERTAPAVKGIASALLNDKAGCDNIEGEKSPARR